MKKFYFLAFVLLVSSCFLFSQSVKVHVVEKGETLYGLCRKYDVKIDEICKLNNFSKDTLLKIGQKVKIPVINNDEATNKSEIVIKNNKTQDIPEKTDTYTVKKGDTLYNIAKQFDISVEILKILNEMSGTTIKIGQVINVPQKVEKNVATVKSEESDKNHSGNTVIVDPRQIDKNKKASTSLLWPIMTEEINYLKGKISGVLLTGKKNENVNAIKAGSVMFSGIYRGFGQVVFIQSANDLMYVYTGLETVNVKKGEKVACGDTVGNLGIDMHSGKPQLNFMVFKNGKPMDPAKAPRG